MGKAIDVETAKTVCKNARTSLHRMEVTLTDVLTKHKDILFPGYICNCTSDIWQALNLMQGIIPLAGVVDDNSIDKALIDWKPTMLEITGFLGMPEVLAQLAEEAAELSQAALKLRRALDKRNPTPVKACIANENLQEEFADVVLCMAMVGFEKRAIERTIRRKIARWATRLEEVDRHD